jgi:hypothetical protein
MALGEDISLYDGKLNGMFNEWLIPIKEDYPELDAEFRRLEPMNLNLESGEMKRLEAIRLGWLPVLGALRTSRADEVRVFREVFTSSNNQSLMLRVA